ncbi:hypothetical protein [Streptomyces boninensis]|uniref:hypothetical protein n=1 Tax=Streptomyces boninensis TaxID=2039455 RepID=UPI003B21B83F
MLRRPWAAVLVALAAVAGLLLSGPASAADPDARRAAADKPPLPAGGIKGPMQGGNTVAAQPREKEPRADGYRHIDTPELIKKLKGMGANSYIFSVWEYRSDWDDLRKEFVPAAEKAGIDVMPYVVPPSECFVYKDHDPDQVLPPHQQGRCSWPYLEDYVGWAKAVAELSKEHTNVPYWAIDDFFIGNQWKFTKEYMAEMKAAQDAINPDLRLYTTAYFGEASGDEFYELYADYIDGIIYPYTGRGGNTMEAQYVERNLDKIREKTEPLGLELILLVYTGRFLASPQPPTEDYVEDVYRRAEPYAADGRIDGVIAYGAAMDGAPAMSSDHKAYQGDGRLNLALQEGTPTTAGESASASQTIKVDPDAGTYELSFRHYDEYGHVSLADYHHKQVLVDGKVVWSADVADDPEQSWKQATADLTEALKGKSEAKLTLRMYENKGVGNYPLEELAFDDLKATGFSLANGGFETKDGWDLAGSRAGAFIPQIDIYALDRPYRIYDVIAKAWGGTGYDWGNPERPKLGPENRAMYGNGRLRMQVPPNTATPAGACTSATQKVPVQGGLPRYELSFWQTDDHEITPQFEGYHYKEVLIDGKPVWKNDVTDWFKGMWINGSDPQGPITVTEFVQGKAEVELTFRLCEAKPVTDLTADVGFDNVTTVGLGVRNPGFESAEDWKLSSTDPGMKTTIDIAK